MLFRSGVTCVVLCVACTLPSIHVYVVFGTAIPISLYIFGKCFSYLFYCIKAQLAETYLSGRPLTWESYDRYTLLRKPSLLLGNGDTNCINHAQIRYVWEIKHSPLGTMHVLYRPYVPIEHENIIFLRGFIVLIYYSNSYWVTYISVHSSLLRPIAM